jgi:glycine cleavage system H protein
MNVPDGLRYTETHEWVRQEGNEVVVGITDFAQHELTDIVFVDLPEVGRELVAGEACCVVESTKVASDVYAPVSGKVVAVNTDLGGHPDLVNSSPYEGGWLIRIAASDPSQAGSLMAAGEYKLLIHD